MNLRTAAPDDAGAIQRVARASWHAAHDDIVGADTVDELLDDWYDRDGLAASIEREEWATFVSVVGDEASGEVVRDEATGEVVGFAQGGPTDEGPAETVVSRIYVHPDRWGEGHGTALLERLFDALRADGHGSVWLAVLADNDVGRSFYDARGFSVHEERTVELAGTEVEDVVLVREL